MTKLSLLFCFNRKNLLTLKHLFYRSERCFLMVNPFKRINAFLDKCPCASKCDLYKPNSECDCGGFNRCGKAYELTKKKTKKK
jgi:hypothetical protein